jgi:hypothetical protein
MDSGTAYFFDIFTGNQLAKLLPSDGEAGDNFGNYGGVGLSGTTAIVGAYGDGDNGSRSGSAYLFDAPNCETLASTTARNGSGLNASILTKVTDPVLGTNWVTNLDCTGHNPAFATIQVFQQPSSGLFLPGGELLVDVTSSSVIALAQIHLGGVVQFAIAVPNDLALCGFTASAQGVVLGAPGYELSNALDLVAGF